MEKVILVDKKDKEIGAMDKLEAHQRGLLHRAFSIFVFNKNGEVLLQRRALSKYHSPGLWSNACCGHPRPGELAEDAAKRRLFEEMGFKCELKYRYKFFYKVHFDNKLFEYECDYVFIGVSDAKPKINKKEVMEYKWLPAEFVLLDMEEHPNLYTYWFKLSFKRALSNL